MPLLDRLGTEHTIRQFRSAVRWRYTEAACLHATNNRLARIYLCGYAAEMLLKAASFRLRG
jgi:hypothetical protein